MKANKNIVILVLLAAVFTAAIYFSLKESDPGFFLKPPEATEKKYTQLLFVGDLMFDRGIRYFANKNGGNEFIFDKIRPILANNDLVITNLEGPITDRKSISSETKPGSTNNYFFTFDPSVAETLYRENIKLVNLGNNHILNFGWPGLNSTKKYLDKAGVNYFGAPEEQKSIIKEIDGIKSVL